MSEISNKVMGKVNKIYFLRRTVFASLKLVFVMVSIGASSTFISFNDVFRNLKHVFNDGSVTLYIADAFSKTESAVLMLLALVFVLTLALLRDLGKITSGLVLGVR